MAPEPTANDALLAVIAGRVVGVVTQAPRTATLRFRYEDAWRELPEAYPLSLSMPLQRAEWPDNVVRVVLGGWIPDRAETLARIAEEYQIATDNPFAVLGAIGEDCPGAVQFVRPDRLDALLEAGAGGVSWITEGDLATHLRTLRTPGVPDRLRGDRGRFSLPGQQPKIALVYEHDDATGHERWGIPDAAHPTTHILKPPMGGNVRYLAAEHLSLRIARAAELSAADTFVMRAEDQTALAVIRYDRIRTPDGRWHRVHQEDLCQALGWSPQLKFERTGGPGAVQAVGCLRERSSRPDEDVERFLLALALNWVIVGTDAHARNYSLLLGAGGGVRLAPLYDVMCVLEVAQPRDVHTLTLPMRVGDSYTAVKIGRSEWRALAAEVGLAPSDVETLVQDFATRLADATAAAAAEVRAEGMLPAEVIDTLESRITRRAKKCARIFDRPSR